jgi:osmotically-inducible protein OsmY
MTRSARDLGVVLWLLCAALLAGCAGDQMSQSTEEVVDDRLLANKVKVALLSDPQVRGRQIMVEGSHGVIQLRGVVHSPAEAQRAVQVAQQVKGVKEVRNHLTVQ